MNTENQKMKQTEIGWISGDWEVRTLNELTNLKNGFAFSSKYFSKAGPIVITPGNFKLEGGLSFTERNTIRYSGPFSGEMRFQKGDLLVVMTDLTPECNLLGKPGIVVNEDIILHNQRIGKVSIKNNSIEKEYLYWFLVSELFSKWMKETATGSTVRHTSVGSFYKAKVPLPPTKAEQTAIATALSDADAWIGSLEKLIEKKRLLKQGAMQELLKPNEGWVVKRLGEVAEIFRGGSPRPIEAYLTQDVEGINWIKIGDVNPSAKYIESTSEKITKEGAVYSRFVNQGDFLLSNSMSFGRPYFLRTSGCIHDGWLVIQNFERNFNPDFLYYSLGFETIINQYRAIAAGSSVLNLNKEIVRNVIVSFPVLEDQTQIATKLNEIDLEITSLEAQLAKARQIKQGMMQQLLTGKIRLI